MAAPANIITNHASLLTREGPIYPEKISNKKRQTAHNPKNTLEQSDKRSVPQRTFRSDKSLQLALVH
jgi:hypothetical protein